MSPSDPRRAVALIPVLLLFALACGPKLSPEEKVELLRSQYTAELKSLTVKQDPLPTEAETSESSADASAEGTEGEPSEPVSPTQVATPVRTDVTLDILVSTTSQEYLPGVTLDVQHVDGDRKEKDRRTIWVDTTGLVRGGGTQVTEVLKDVDYQPGDGFFVEIRSPIPPEERAGYREFQAH